MHSIDGDYFPVLSPLFATYLHRNLIGTSSELRRIFAVRSPRELRQIADVISAYLCTRIILEILLSLTLHLICYRKITLKCAFSCISANFIVPLQHELNTNKQDQSQNLHTYGE